MQSTSRAPLWPTTLVGLLVFLTAGVSACSPSRAGGAPPTPDTPAAPDAPPDQDAPAAPDAPPAEQGAPATQEAPPARGAGAQGLEGAPAPFRLPTTSHTISEVQGRAHRSPLEGETVTDVPGIVTSTSGTSFVMECSGDGDPATSDALQVYVGRGFKAMPQVGDRVVVSGRVVEWGGLDDDRQPLADVVTQTQIERPSEVRVLESGFPLPGPVRLGAQGRMPPLDAVASSVKGEYDVERFALDFWESLESMRVEVRDAVFVGPSVYGEVTVLPDGGEGYANRTRRGGLLIDPRTAQGSPGRVTVSGPHARHLDKATVGDRARRIEGIIGHDRFGPYKLFASAPLEGYVPGGLPRVPTTLSGDAEHLTIGSFNVQNFSVVDGRERALELARGIVEFMRAPDIVGLQEVIDDDGAGAPGKPGHSDVVSAAKTLNLLCEAIVELGGPRYRFVEVAPLPHLEGGIPGGNIRVAYLYDPERVSFERRGEADATTPNRVERLEEGARLALNPGRVAPDAPAFADTRRTLGAEFTFNGRRVVLLNSHLCSRRFDDPQFGPTQPPVLHTEPQRIELARALNAFVRELTQADPTLTIVALGDYNDFEFRPALKAMAGEEMTILNTLLPPEERYSYVYQGTSQALDHMLLGGPLREQPDAVALEYVHVCAEYPAKDRISDHDPIVLRLRLP